MHTMLQPSRFLPPSLVSNLIYGDLFSTVKKLGIKMCIDQKIIRQQLKNAKRAKYEMGNFCEQFGSSPIAPSRKNRKKSDKVFQKETCSILQYL
jgi:hypothetical protein